ncbi:hypothetical protein F4703DRAFT_1792132 [Phycomyces blakesleeanus]
MPFINNIIQKMSSINLLGQVYKSESFIQSLFIRTNSTAIKTYTGQIQYIFLNDIIDLRLYEPICHTFVYVKWYNSAVENATEVRDVVTNDFEFFADDFHCILPVHCISLSAAIGEHVNEEGVVKIVIVSILRKIYA